MATTYLLLTIHKTVLPTTCSYFVSSIFTGNRTETFVFFVGTKKEKLITNTVLPSPYGDSHFLYLRDNPRRYTPRYHWTSAECDLSSRKVPGGLRGGFYAKS